MVFDLSAPLDLSAFVQEDDREAGTVDLDDLEGLLRYAVKKLREAERYAIQGKGSGACEAAAEAVNTLGRHFQRHAYATT